jgi:hypothetical protein
MDLSQAPAFVAAKKAQLSDARAAAATRADELIAQISFVRDRLNGRVVREGDHPAELRIELDRLLAESEAPQHQRPIETDTIDRCKAWLAALPAGTVLKQVIPDAEDGLSLTAVRARIKKLQESVAVLKRVPIPAPDIRQKVQFYVQGLTRPVVGEQAHAMLADIRQGRDPVIERKARAARMAAGTMTVARPRLCGSAIGRPWRTGPG